MKVATTGAVSRRALIASAGAALLAPSISVSSGFAASQSEYRIVAGPSEARLAGGAYLATKVWAFVIEQC
jgi:hypothetical protein